MYIINDYNNAIAERLGIETLDESAYFPKYFEIETIRACNAKCIMCPINDWDINGKLMDLKLFERFSEEVSHYSDWINTICLNRDGEPTLDRFIAKRIGMLKSAGIKKITLSTNGQLLTKKLAEEMIINGIDDIMLSIDGLKKETFEKIRRGLNYETVLKNVTDLISLRNELKPEITIRIRMIIIDENRDEVSDWLRFWKEKVKENDRVYAMPEHSWGNQTYEEKNETVALYADKPCVSPFSSVAMHADGRIGLCGADFNAKYLMGDFTAHTIKEIWNGVEFSRVRDLHANKKMRNEIELCKGCHIWEREYSEGDIDSIN